MVWCRAWPRCWSATIRPAKSMSATRTRPPRRWASIRCSHHLPPTTASEDDVLAKVRALNADKTVHGILVQMPLPKQVREAAVLDTLDPAKDVDALTPTNAGLLLSGPRASGLLHAGRRDDAAQGICRRHRRHGRAGHRPLASVRQTGGAASAGRQRHRDHGAFAERATCRRWRGAPTFWSPPSASRAMSRATGSSRAPP